LGSQEGSEPRWHSSLKRYGRILQSNFNLLVKDHFAEVIIFVAGATQACQFNRESPLSRFALLSSPPNQTKTYSARNNEQSIQSHLLFLEAAEADEIRIFRKALFYPYQFGWFLNQATLERM